MVTRKEINEIVEAVINEGSAIKTWETSWGRITVRQRNDKKSFEVNVNGVEWGIYQTAKEAKQAAAEIIKKFEKGRHK